MSTNTKSMKHRTNTPHNRNIALWLTTALLVFGLCANAQTYVEVNIDVNHTVGGEDSFNREKWMVVSSSQSSGEWSDIMDKFEYISNDLDTYWGRETGHIKSYSKTVNQDPNRPGYADTTYLESMGAADIIKYAGKTDRHAYEKGNFIVANQQTPIFPNDHTATNGGWYYNSEDTDDKPFGTASAEYCTHYFNNFYGNGGTSGFPMPTYFEIMNEPVWHFVDGSHDGKATVEQVFKFHQTVADKIHQKVPGLKVGGYGTAFPDMDKGGDLKQWDERWRLFIEDYGDAFDFYTLHLYDKPIWYGREVYRKGGRNEATFDLMEHFSMLTHGETKPLLITEYGTQLWGLTDEERLWRPYNDWTRVKAFNAMLMQFLERPNVIAGALPFAVPKGEWGYDTEADIPYRCRLLRKANEPEDYSGDWVWTEYIKFYELWAEVKGLRLDTYSDNLDFQVDAYANGKEVYVILNNIENVAKNFDLNIKGINNNTIESLEVKRLYFSEDSLVVLNQEIMRGFDGAKELRGDETIIAKYIFKDNVNVDQTSSETKYYATTYKQPIETRVENEFTFENVEKGSNGEAVLRIGLCREIGSTHFPRTIEVNGNTVDVPSNYRGDIQLDRDNFFGMIEVQVPFEYIQSGSNSVALSFSGTDGFVSSCALQVFNFSREIKRSGTTAISEITQSRLYNLYPIPANDLLKIEGDIQSWKLYSMAGNILQEGIENQVPLSHLPAGTYLLQMDDKEVQTFTKI